MAHEDTSLEHVIKVEDLDLKPDYIISDSDGNIEMTDMDEQTDIGDILVDGPNTESNLLSIRHDLKKEEIISQHKKDNEAQIRGSEQSAEPQSAKMLIFLQNGEQRLITFTLPKKSCTLQEVLEQVNVPFSEDTHIQCMQSTSSEIDYFVSVGSTTRIKDMLVNHPMLVGDISSRSSLSVKSQPSQHNSEMSTKNVTMEKCRLCLRVQKRVHSLNTTKDGIKYCAMVYAISSNIKIDTGTDDKLCVTCCRKLEAAYNFKVMIERSDEELQNLSKRKRITFSTIEDIKAKIEITEDDKNILKHDIIELINSDDVEFRYNDTLLRRKRSKKKPLNVPECFNSINEELDNSFDDYEGVDHSDVENEPRVDHSDVDYVPGKSCGKQRKTSKTETKKNKYKDTIFFKKPLKPTLVRNIRVKADVQQRKKKVCNEKSKKKPRVCPYCGKLFSNLKSHMWVHSVEKKFECDICKKGYHNPVALKAHLNGGAHLPKTLRCDLCVAVFSTKTALIRHMKTHSDVKKFLCEICSKAFKRAYQVELHKAHVHHIGLKEYKCDYCEKTCKSQTLLEHHLRVHTGERPYKCEMCSQPYSYKHDFNRHCFKKHSVLFKRRSVYVMNEEVLKKERALMRDLMLRINGVIKEDVPLNPFEGAQGAQAYELVTKALAAGQITLDFDF